MSSLRLYVFIRSDLESMTVGKCAAQVAHAASQCANELYQTKEYLDWMTEDRDGFDSDFKGFGTTIVLDGGAFKDDGTDCIPAGFEKHCIGWGEVSDPTYPIRDGKKTHHVPLRTCYWALIEKDRPDDPLGNYVIDGFLSKFKLYNGNHD
jgi:hypothetical protein